MTPGKKDETGKLVRLRPQRPCPICGQPATREAWPFCSPRCADVDLNRWLSGQYRIPASQEEDEAAGEEEGEGATPSPPDDSEG